jgi:hypothetical protein
MDPDILVIKCIVMQFIKSKVLETDRNEGKF